MSKVNAIRKKALDYVRGQDWQSAIKEYKRLADLDQSNPNVFNELGDIYLKTGNKTEAYNAFTRAIDSYTRVSLHNNAVAVCKKVLRLIPSRYDVLIKLGLIRKKQGLAREAESYYFGFFDKLLADQQIGPADVKKNCAEVTSEMGDSVPVLERVYECLVKFNLKEETGGALQKLYALYTRSANQTEINRTQERLSEIGQTPEEVRPAVAEDRDKGVVITEDNIWSEAHTEGERIDIDGDPNQQDGQTPVGVPGGTEASKTPDSVYEYGNLQIGGEQPPGTAQGPPVDSDLGEGGPPPDRTKIGGSAAPETTTETVTQPDGQSPPDGSSQVDEAAPAASDAGVGAPMPDPDTGAPVFDVSPDSTADADPFSELTGDNAAPSTQGGGAFPGAEQSAESGVKTSSGIQDSPDEIRVSAIIDELDDESGGEITDDDYRSHYDLGMAYLEMDLLAEAIREYQIASKSPAYQCRALEMIGLCFLRQNQANLAIKQLTKGLQMIGDNDNEALGIKYNLGLAYEMIGDFEKAKSEFEDVYVEDVTFRDVAEKIEKFS